MSQTSGLKRLADETLTALRGLYVTLVALVVLAVVLFALLAWGVQNFLVFDTPPAPAQEIEERVIESY